MLCMRWKIRFWLGARGLRLGAYMKYVRIDSPSCNNAKGEFNKHNKKRPLSRKTTKDEITSAVPPLFHLPHQRRQMTLISGKTPKQPSVDTVL